MPRLSKHMDESLSILRQDEKRKQLQKVYDRQRRLPYILAGLILCRMCSCRDSEPESCDHSAGKTVRPAWLIWCQGYQKNKMKRREDEAAFRKVYELVIQRNLDLSSLAI